MNCVLCSARDNEQFRTVYEDDLLWVVLNHKPIHEMHVMILPVRHIENWNELTSEESVAMMNMFDRCMHFFEKESGNGVNCVINSWKFRTQEHLHAHIIPNEHGAGRYSDEFLSSGKRSLADEKLQEKLTKELKKRF
jgi:diadenosine tetraphosphate (Ap4A) HIT family hydrolase